jgi:hypothetical protein
MTSRSNDISCGRAGRVGSPSISMDAPWMPMRGSMLGAMFLR